MNFTTLGSLAIIPIALCSAFVTAKFDLSLRQASYADPIVTGALPATETHSWKSDKSLSSSSPGEALFQSKGCALCHSGPELGMAVHLIVGLVNDPMNGQQGAANTSEKVSVKPLRGRDTKRLDLRTTRQKIAEHSILFPGIQRYSASEVRQLADFVLSQQQQLPNLKGR